MRRALGLSTLLLFATAARAEPLPLEVPVEALVGDASTVVALGPEGGVRVDLADAESRRIDLSARAHARRGVVGTVQIQWAPIKSKAAN